MKLFKKNWTQEAQKTRNDRQHNKVYSKYKELKKIMRVVFLFGISKHNITIKNHK